MGASDNLQPKQFSGWTPSSALYRNTPNYPTKGYRKDTDKVTAQQRLMGAGRGYDAHASAARVGVIPNLN